MSYILICDDERDALKLLQIYLQNEGYRVVTVNTENEVVEQFKNELPDLLLLDISIEEMSGFDLMIDTKSFNVPTIILSEKKEMADKIKWLEIGVDDYITKPFNVTELALRIRALLRRTKQNGDYPEKIIICNELEINLSIKTVSKRNKQLILTRKEFQMLSYFALNKGRTIQRTELLNTLWGHNYIGDGRVVDILILRLRKKIEDNPKEPAYIRTVFGFGYIFC